MGVSCPICRSLTQDGLSIYTTVVREAGEKGCQFCRTIVSGIDRIEEAEGFPAAMLKSHRLSTRHLKGGTVLIETKDKSSKRLYELELYALEGSNTTKIFGGASAVPSHGSLDRITTLAKKWIKECEESHVGCENKLDPILPRRVLDVSRCETTGNIYLSETGGMPGAYITLSHCWGAYQPIQTTKESLLRMKAGIPILSLPKTFLDAVIVTNALCFRYLWIDSLCILQDSEEDWEEQSAQMAAIYSNSYLTLAASHAANSSVGFECERQAFSGVGILQESQPVESYEIPNSKRIFGEPIFVRHSQAQAHADIMSKADIKKMRVTYGAQDDVKTSKRAPLLSRAWAFQERLLSPRTLHCHSGELMWECRTGIACECNGLNKCNTAEYDHPKAGLSRIGEMASPDVFNLWYSYVQKYSMLQLSYSSDCLPALSGPASWISRRISRLTNDGKYFAGLWHRDFVLGLLWYVDREYGITGVSRRSPYQAPTWSWASVRGPIEYFQIRSIYLRPKPMSGFKILDVFCEREGKNVFGKVSFGSFTCRGTLLPAHVIKSEEDGQQVAKLNIQGLGCFFRGTTHQEVQFRPYVDFWLPGPEQVKQGETIYVLVISCEEYAVHGLVLKQREFANEEYTRLGFFETYRYESVQVVPDYEVQVKEFIRTIRVV